MYKVDEKIMVLDGVEWVSREYAADYKDGVLCHGGGCFIYYSGHCSMNEHYIAGQSVSGLEIGDMVRVGLVESREYYPLSDNSWYILNDHLGKVGRITGFDGGIQVAFQYELFTFPYYALTVVASLGARLNKKYLAHCIESISCKSDEVADVLAYWYENRGSLDVKFNELEDLLTVGIERTVEEINP